LQPFNTELLTTAAASVHHIRQTLVIIIQHF